jgi:FkbM family methyltransferase
MLYKRLKEVLSRPEVQRNPLQALFKRIAWRWRWLGNSEPFIIPLGSSLKIAIPKTGSGASIYYRGFSEPDTADFLQRFLQPGMVMVDIGAHIGEYTLLASHAVGRSGQVHAFEPQAPIFPILRKNVEINGLENVVLNDLAVGDQVGELEFELANEPSMSSIRKHDILDQSTQVVKVPVTTLGTYWSEHISKKVDLIKVDVEGAEKFVFLGATSLMEISSAEAPTWIFEYGPQAYADFNYQPAELLNLIQQYGYSIWQYSAANRLTPFDPQATLPDIVNLIATKNPVQLAAQLEGVAQKIDHPTPA